VMRRSSFSSDWDMHLSCCDHHWLPVEIENRKG
jgi:hypothetical protein